MTDQETRQAESPELTERLQDVLRELVLLHVSTGSPVSSRSLAKEGEFDLSPATLRNAMADLEELGLLSHPHTSAGRVPTDKGYRYFIDRLMRSRTLPRSRRERIERELDKATDLPDTLGTVSRLLSEMSDNVGVVFFPSILQLQIRSIDLISVGPGKLMCVIVGMNGFVIHRIVDVSFEASRDELKRMSNRLTEDYGGQTLGSIRSSLTSLLERDRAVYDLELRRMAALGIEIIDDAGPLPEDLWLNGTSTMLDKPDFEDLDSLRSAIRALEDREKIVEVLNGILDRRTRRVLIGSESGYTDVHNFGIVSTRYGYASRPVGVIGVIGPIRMPYSSLTPLVSFLGEALSRRIEERSVEVVV